MATHRYSIWIDAKPELVWEIFTEVDRIPEWQTGGPVVTDVSGRGDMAGTTYAVRRGPGVAHTTVLEAIRPSRYRSRTDAYLGLWFETIALLVSEKGGTRLDLETH
ncbi:MAG: SRPBCC family protein, partial [Chloroflexi bacterium]